MEGMIGDKILHPKPI